MSGAFVTKWDNTTVGNATTQTVTVGTPSATADNLLIGCIAVKNGGDAFTEPTGWTVIHTTSLGAFGVAVYRRKATGTSADDFACEWTDSGTPGAMVVEMSGLDADTAPEADNIVDSGGASVTTLQGTSTTPLTANGTAISILIGFNITDWAVAQTTIDASFTIDGVPTWPSAAPNVSFASKNYTSTAAHSPTWTTTDVGNEAMVSMLVFKDTAAGGLSIPVAMNNYYRQRMQ